MTNHDIKLLEVAIKYISIHLFHPSFTPVVHEKYFTYTPAGRIVVGGNRAEPSGNLSHQRLLTNLM